MNRIPGEKPIPNKNRSSKQNYILSRSGIKHLHEWQKSKGIRLCDPPKKEKNATKKTQETK